MSIHREGYKILIFGFLTLLVINIIAALFIGDMVLLRWILGFASLILYVFLLFFFRLPARHLEPDPGLIYAPADGKVVVIEETEEKEYFNEKKLQV